MTSSLLDNINPKDLQQSGFIVFVSGSATRNAWFRIWAAVSGASSTPGSNSEVPHQANATWRVHGGRGQRREPPVRDSRRLAHEAPATWPMQWARAPPTVPRQRRLARHSLRRRLTPLQPYFCMLDNSRLPDRAKVGSMGGAPEPGADPPSGMPWQD